MIYDCILESDQFVYNMHNPCHAVAYQQNHVIRNAEVNAERRLSSVSFLFSRFFFFLSQYFTMIPTVVVLYLNVLILLNVAACFDDNKPKWPVPYRYENAISVLIPAIKSCDS